MKDLLGFIFSKDVMALFNKRGRFALYFKLIDWAERRIVELEKELPREKEEDAE